MGPSASFSGGVPSAVATRLRLFFGGGARWSAWSAKVFRPSRPPSGLFPRSNLHVFDKVFLSYLPLLPASASGGCSPCNRWLAWRSLLTSQGGNGGPTARASSSGGVLAGRLGRRWYFAPPARHVKFLRDLICRCLIRLCLLCRLSSFASFSTIRVSSCNYLGGLTDFRCLALICHSFGGWRGQPSPPARLRLFLGGCSLRGMVGEGISPLRPFIWSSMLV